LIYLVGLCRYPITRFLRLRYLRLLIATWNLAEPIPEFWPIVCHMVPLNIFNAQSISKAEYLQIYKNVL